MTKSAIAPRKPNSTALLNSSLRFSVFVCAFMTVIISLHAIGSNANNHHVSASARYFSLSFDFRMSSLAQCLKFLDTNDTVSSVQSSWRNIDRLPRELPDRDERT